MTPDVAIPRGLQAVALLVVMAFLVWVLRLVRSQRLTLRDSLVWVITTLVATLFVVFPNLLLAVTGPLGI